MLTQAPTFIVVDDDPINNLLCKEVIKSEFPDAEVKTFIEPEKGLDYIKATFTTPYDSKTILFLDINMPTMTGWEFMEQFETFDSIIKDQFRIYILSSSVNPTDIDRAHANEYVIEYLEKPLSFEILDSLI